MHCLLATCCALFATEEEPPTPIAANGRAAEVTAQMEAKSVYKHRLETIQKNRQQRAGRNGTSDTATTSNHPISCDGSLEKKRRSKSRPPMGHSH